MPSFFSFRDTFSLIVISRRGGVKNGADPAGPSACR